MPKRNNTRYLFIGLLVYAAGFAVSAVWDLAINQAVFAPASLPGIVMECFGWYPAFLPAILLFLILMTGRGLPVWQRVAGGVVAILGFAALYYISYGYMVKRQVLSSLGDPLAVLWVAAGLLFASVMAFATARMSAVTRVKMQFFAIWGAVYMLANQAVIYPVKTLWARTRFDDMVAAGSLDAFTPWYLPFGNGGSSFPSGHTANAAGIFMLLVLCDLFPTWAKHRRLVYLGCWGYIVLMAACRIRIGRHFLSDTLAASAIMAVLFYAMRATGAYRNGLRKAAPAATPATTPIGDPPQ